ncbi:MAG: hypothetical protein RMK45_10220, partial [Armatimonadota bacterium]|nr:hypothetical protein [Armatimonadota bacterium]
TPTLQLGQDCPSHAAWHGHLARSGGTDSRVRALVGEDADATAWTGLSKPQVLGRDADPR